MSTEDRLRRALTDADWTLPSWIAPGLQLRRAARRRMAVVSSACVAAVAIVALGVAVPLVASADRGGQRPFAPAVYQGNIYNTKPPLPGVNDPRFPSSVYPMPTVASRGNYPQCPSVVGVGPRPSLNPAAYSGLVTDFGHPSLLNDLRRADRSLWPLILAADENPPSPRPRQEPASTLHPARDITVIPALQDDLSQQGIHACGSELLKDSVAIRVGPNARMDPPLEDFWVLQRHGQLLMWSHMPSIWANGSFLNYRNQTKLMYPEPIDPCDLGAVAASTHTANSTSIRLVLHNGKMSSYSCTLVGWPNVTLIRPPDFHPLRTQPAGPDTPVILRPGDTASVVISARTCSGPRHVYDDVTLGGSQSIVSLPVGPCGVTVSSYHLE